MVLTTRCYPTRGRGREHQRIAKNHDWPVLPAYSSKPEKHIKRNSKINNNHLKQPNLKTAHTHPSSPEVESPGQIFYATNRTKSNKQKQVLRIYAHFMLLTLKNK